MTTAVPEEVLAVNQAMDYFLHGFGVFLGVIAGTAVTVLAGLFFQGRKETQQVRNLRFELELNLSKVDKWLEEIIRYRNAVNGESRANRAVAAVLFGGVPRGAREQPAYAGKAIFR